MKLLSPSVALACIVGLSACEKLAYKSTERVIERAERQTETKDYKGAVTEYEEALGTGARAAEIHYRLAILYDDKLHMPAGAVHHFQRYLELSPEGIHAKDAKAFIKEAEFRLQMSLAHGAFMTQEEAARLKNENLALRKQLAELRAQPRAIQPATKGKQPVPVVPPAGARTYVVQPGDTLASISRKFYKTTARWKDISDANFNALNGSNNLKPGQTLVVP